MQQAISKLAPKGGFSHVFHIGLMTIFPLVLFILVRLDLTTLALGLVFVSKWRMFAVKPRFWIANIRANSVDILVGLSIVLFMAHHNTSFVWQISWMVGYVIWLTVIKPGSTTVYSSLQAMTGLLLPLMALFMVAGDVALGILVVAVGLICYLAAHHFLESFDEPFTKFLAHMWAFVGAALTWVLGHWLLYYGILAQPTLILVVLGYGLAGLYYFDHHDRLSRIIRLEFTFIVLVVIVINLIALAVSSRSGTLI